MDKPDRLEVFRKMLDPKNWPVKQDQYFILDGEILEFRRTNDPLEECVFRPLYQ